LALPLLDEAARLEAREVSLHATSSATTPERATLHYEYGLALMRSGQADAALPWLERAAQEQPGDRRTAEALAESHHAGAATHAAGGGADAHVARGTAAARGGDLTLALREFQAAADADPRSIAAWGGLVRARIESGALDSAAVTLERARVAGFPPPQYWAHAAVIAAAHGQAAAARQALARVPDAAIANDPVLRDVVNTARRLLGDASR
jgi:tetratricopeptide (TPR) repeat protein